MTDIRSSSGGSSRGLYGSQYDRYVERYDDSTLSRMQLQYWETKQTFLRKLKRKEDDCVVASDAELDAKLELLRSIDESCQNLISVLEAYQDRVCGLAHEESSAGRFLKECGKVDKTRAGKMMTASGKTLSYCAQQRIQLRNPLVRLYQEVETFQYRAVADTMLTIDKMEKARTAYRGALLWMKDVSQVLDPDTYKQLEKFRKVQSHVRRTKARFDKLKLDTLQKVDLLSASRCNMYSNALVGYQTALLQFWEKSSRTMNAVAESFKGYQFYEFTMLRELTETSKKLAQTDASDDILNIFDDTDDDDKDRLIFFESEYRDRDDERKPINKSNSDSSNKKSKSVAKKTSNLSQNKPKSSHNKDIFGEPNNVNALLDLSFDHKPNQIDNNVEKQSNTTLTKDILTSSDLKVDDLTLLNEILNAPTTPVIEANLTNSASIPKSDLFMPSQLLDLDHCSANNYFNPISNSMTKTDNNEVKKSINLNPSKEKGIAGKKSDMSSWFNLFADLDPLANPDAVGKKSNEGDDRNC